MADEGCENPTILTNDPSAPVGDRGFMDWESSPGGCGTYHQSTPTSATFLYRSQPLRGLVTSEPSYSSDLSEQFHEACDNDTDCSGAYAPTPSTPCT